MVDSIGPDEETSYESLISSARRAAGEAFGAMRRRELAPRDRMEAWQREASRGARARSFVTGDFWVKDLEPLLRGQSVLKPCAPDAIPKSIESAATEYLYKSGSSWLAGFIEKNLRDWIAAGDKATLELRAENEKRKEIARK